MRNITYAFMDTLEKILKDGSYSTTRGNNQREILSQLIKMEKPKERVILVPHRNNNIFALIAETMWVLAGRNDMEYLSHYLPRATDFSDDGKVWRAAYGPRLRNWSGIDQFKETARILNCDNNTKRAVMVIYDPKKDYVETKDVPCNNWLNFMIRDGKLNLNVAVRANDAVWGFGGINSFEWSMLQEMMAFWTNSEVGTLSWFVGTIHVYERHYNRSQKILDSFKEKTIYEFGINSPKFGTKLEDFDSELARWFNIEKRISQGASPEIYKEIEQIRDELFKNSLEMIYIYNEYLNNSSKEDIAQLVENLVTNDFKMAAIEYFTRVYKDRDMFKLTKQEEEFFNFYWNCLNNNKSNELEKLVLI